MPTILRFRGFNIMIFVEDHEPAHVHAWKQGSLTAFWIDPSFARVTLRGNSKLASAETAALIAFIEENRAMLLEAWMEVHGDKPTA